MGGMGELYCFMPCAVNYILLARLGITTVIQSKINYSISVEECRRTSNKPQICFP